MWRSRFLQILIVLTIILSIATIPSKPVSTDSNSEIYLDPDYYVFNSNNMSLHGEFNVTIKMRNATDLFDWQVKLWFRNDILNATGNAWYTPDEPVSQGGPYAQIPLEHWHFNLTHSYILWGISSLGASYNVSEAGLCIFEFDVIKVPGAESISSGLTLDDLFTFWEDSEGHIHYPTLTSGYYEYLESMPPTITILSPENRTYGSTSVPLTFIVNETAFWMGYSLDGGTNKTVTGNTTLIDLSEGVHTLIVYANDSLNNMGSSMVSFGTDTIPPVITIASPENTSYTGVSVPLLITVNEPVSWMGYSLDGEANITITGNTTLSDLVEGPHRVLVYANDAAGNMGVSEKVHFTVEVPFFMKVWWIVVVILGGSILVIAVAYYLWKRSHK